MSIRRAASSSLLALTFGAPIAGCQMRGKLIGTAELLAPGTASTRLRVSTTSVRLWADTDITWTGSKSSKPNLTYDVEARQGGASLGRVTCSTMERAGTTFCGTSTTVGASHDADCEYALSCLLPPFAVGDLELVVTGRIGANVGAVKKMSLNVREE